MVPDSNCGGGTTGPWLTAAYGVFSIMSDGVRWMFPLNVCGNGSTLDGGEPCVCEMDCGIEYCEELEESGRPSASAGNDPGGGPLRAGDGPRALDRNGSSGSSRDGDSGMAGCDCGGDRREREDAR